MEHITLNTQGESISLEVPSTNRVIVDNVVASATYMWDELMRVGWDNGGAKVVTEHFAKVLCEKYVEEWLKLPE